MISFQVYRNGKLADSWPIRNAYVVGADGNPMRCDITFKNGLIVCDVHEMGSAALFLQHSAGDLGEVMLQTCLLPDRDEPYLLSLELARHRLMTVFNKLEDWAMLDLEEAHPVSKRTDKAQKAFIEALCHQKSDPAGSTRLANESLMASLDGSEELALAHSELLLNRRKEANAVPRAPVGCGIGLAQGDDRLRAGLANSFDYVQLPLPWKQLAPEENAYNWDLMDKWAEWAGRARKPIIAGPVISFEPSCLPDWLYIWEHDYDTVRDLIYEHIERVVTRYKGVVSAWNIVSGLHVNNHFTFTFEQIMDLTRMSTMLVKKLHPPASVLIELRQPFGEYHGENPRSIPPMMYIDLLIQSAIQFDGFSLRLPIGQAINGQYTRDLMQISSLMDQFAGLGKGVFVTLSAPSEPVSQVMIAKPSSDEPVDDNCGYWRRPWSASVQGHWLEAVFQIAMSKPFIEGVAWQDLIDHQDIELPLAGLVSELNQPKTAYKRIVMFRRSLLDGRPEMFPSTNGQHPERIVTRPPHTPPPPARVDPG